MAKKTNAGASPRLRFPEFQEDGAWKPVPLKDLSERITDKVGHSKLTPVSISAGRGYVAQAEKFGRDISGAQYEKYIRIKRGDFAYNRGNSKLYPQGCVYRLTEFDEAAASNAFYCFRLGSSNAPGFFEGLFQKNAHGPQLTRHLSSGARSNGLLNIAPDKFFDVRLPLPPRTAEQWKIADCLTSLRDVIAAQVRKVEALLAHKRGLMQKIFPRDGETVPRLRFPQFARDRSWHTAKISGVLRKVSRPVTVSPDLSYREIGIRSHGKGIFHKEPVTGATIGGKRVFYVVQNALVVNIVFAWEQAVATTSHAEDGMIASHRFPMFVARPGKCDVRYVKEFLLTKRGKHLLGVASPGGAGRNKTLGQNEFDNLEIALPESVEEQAHIADFLALLEGRIVAESALLDALASHETGLMQQLFPTPDVD